jgi:hypothetical protein
MKAEGVASLRSSLDAKPSTTALLPLIAELDAQGGRESTVSSNSRSSEPRNADGSFMMWIIDDSGNGIASTQAGPGQDEVVIDRSCTSLRAR